MKPIRLKITSLAWLGSALIGTSMGAVAAPSGACQKAVSTLELNNCLDQALRKSDADLLRALQQVARNAADVPSPAFASLWRQNLTGFFKTSANAQDQFNRFQSERRKLCAYAKSMSFQGTGYSSFILQCELAFNHTLSEQLKP